MGNLGIPKPLIISKIFRWHVYPYKVSDEKYDSTVFLHAKPFGFWFFGNEKSRVWPCTRIEMV